jgi:hypothetical protein
MVEAYAYDITCWKTTRKRALKRDNNVCRICLNPDKKPVVHHILPRNEGGPDTQDNLLTVCEECHWNEHRKLRRGLTGEVKCLQLTSTIGANVDSKTAKEFKKLCDERGITPSEGARQLIQQELKRVGRC